MGLVKLKTAVVYWSNTGNTEKVAEAVRQGLEDAGMKPTMHRVEETEGVDYADYGLFCLGFPSFEWHPPKPVTDYLRRNLVKHRKMGLVKTGSPRVPGKHALIFCTYSGPHTGLNEATPAVKYAGQFFEHIGFDVAAEWCILAEFHGREEESTKGRMGDIRGKPTEEDLEKVRGDTRRLALSLRDT